MGKHWYLWRLYWRLFFSRVKHPGAYVADYRQIIDERLAKDERLKVILGDLGTPKEITAAILRQPGTRLRRKWTWQEILAVIFMLIFGVPLLIWILTFALGIFVAVVIGLLVLSLIGWAIIQLTKRGMKK